MEGRVDEVWIHVYPDDQQYEDGEPEWNSFFPLNREDFSNIVHSGRHSSGGDPAWYLHQSAVMDHVVPNYVTGFIFGALVESFCSEQNARMMAMQSASDNAAALLS